MLINAIGVPPAMWRRFLADRSHGLRLFVFESTASDVLAGGMRSCAGLVDDSDAAAEALDGAHGGPVDVVAWCSGARAAIRLAARHPGESDRSAWSARRFRG